MNPYETVRKKIVDRVKAFHTASYPTMKVDYPNFAIVDPEVEAEFVQVEVPMSSKQLDLSGRRCLRVTGTLYCSHFRRAGTGLKAFTTYTDLLFSYLGLKVLDGVTYNEVIPNNRSGLPGFDTTMNSVQFQFDYFE